jgi:hypothetical protein
MIAAINCTTYYLLIKYAFKTDGAVHNIWGPIIVLAISTFVTTHMFLGLFDEATLATLMSFAVDMDLNAESNDGKPKHGPPSFHQKMAKILEFKTNKKIINVHEEVLLQDAVIATTREQPRTGNQMV